MANEDQLVSSAGGSDHSLIGSSSEVVNAAGTIAPPGFSSYTQPSAALVSDPGRNGRLVEFSLLEGEGYLGRLDFTVEIRPITAVSAGDTSNFPTHAIENTSDQIEPYGVPTPFSAVSSRALIADVANIAHLDFTGGAGQQDPSIQLAWGDNLLISSVGSGELSRLGIPSTTSGDFISPSGISPPLVSGRAIISDDRLARSVPLELFGEGNRNPAISFSFGGASLIAAGGLNAFAAGHVDAQNTSQTILPVGISDIPIKKRSLVSGRPRLEFDFVVVKEQDGSNVSFSFFQLGEADIVAEGFDTARFGSVGFVVEADQELEPSGISPASGIGNALVKRLGEILSLQGKLHSSYGNAYIWNDDQYLGHESEFELSIYGDTYVQGGVKFSLPYSWDSLNPGNPDVANTTADQYVQAAGFLSVGIGGPSVGPITLFPAGHKAGDIGIPLVQPNPSPYGFTGDGYGEPNVIFKNRWLQVAGGEFFGAGYPVVRDRAQDLLHKSSPDTTIFGDGLVKLLNLFVGPEGFYTFGSAPWAELRNLNRYVYHDGINPGLCGDVEIQNRWPNISPDGFSATLFGVQAAGAQIREVVVSGMPPLFDQLPEPELWKTPSINPQGMQSPAVQMPTIWPYLRTVETVGSDSHEDGDTSINYLNRVLSLDDSGIDTSDYGAHRVEDSFRAMLADGFAFDKYGRPWISYGQRILAPDGIWEDFAASYMVGGLRVIAPDGYVASRFGERIIPEIQSVYPLGFTSGFGDLEIRSQWTFVSPDGVAWPQPEDRWGVGQVWNSRQYITVDYDSDNLLNPPPWPQWTNIANRNKQMMTFGAKASFVARPSINNAATPVFPQGIAPPYLPEDQEAGLVAYRVRSVLLPSIEYPLISAWSAVWNVADLVHQQGCVATEFGQLAIVNTRRNYDRVGGFDSSVFGYPFVADAVRGIEFERRYAIEPPQIDLPKVELYTRYVNDAGGLSAPEVGLADLLIRINRISPSWALRHYFGMPELKNLTPELGQRGRNSEVFGNASVRLEWRQLITGESYMQRFGNTLIADSTRVLSINGTKAWTVSDKLTVIKTGAPPYSPQWVTLVSDAYTPDNPTNGYGIPPPGLNNDNPPHSRQMGEPFINQQYLYAISEDPLTKFGDPVITANSIRVEPGYWERAVGDHFVSLYVRELVVGKFEDDQVFDPSKPRLSPHTIWSTKEAPEQARDNHPTARELHYVGEILRAYLPGERFGRQRIENKDRILSPSGVRWGNGFHGLSGETSIANRRSYINVSGSRTQRFGWASVPGDQWVIPFDIYHGESFGYSKVSRPPYAGPRYILSQGFSSCLWTAARVERFDREIEATGTEMLRMGTKKEDDTPYQWQGLRVGPLVPTIADGFSDGAYGDAWISLRVRGISAQGYDAHQGDMDPRFFPQRMKVRHGTPIQPENTRITTIGRLSQEFGPVFVRNNTRYIRPDGNSDQHRKGAW